MTAALLSACNARPLALGADGAVALNDAGFAPNDAGFAPNDAGLAPNDADACPLRDLAREDADAGRSFRRVFVSSGLYTANFGGLSGADAICQRLAAAACLDGTFKAWLSDGTIDARTRLTHAAQPYVLVDGTLVAADWDALTSRPLEHAIDLTESGVVKSASGTACGGASAVWSATQEDGTLWHGGGTCENWTTTLTSGSQSFGDVGRYSEQQMWSAYCSGTQCSTTASLYCFEQ